MTADPYAAGVLDPEVHGRLVADMENIALAANIQAKWIYSKLASTCTPEEVNWVKRFRFHTAAESAGLIYLGKDFDPDVETRMSAVAGALTRNFVRARLMTLNELLAEVGEGAVPDVTCLLVPNFYAERGAFPAWRASLLYEALVHRHAKGLQTVLHVADLNGLGIEYGLSLKRHVDRLYHRIEH